MNQNEIELNLSEEDDGPLEKECKSQIQSIEVLDELTKKEPKEIKEMFLEIYEKSSKDDAHLLFSETLQEMFQGLCSISKFPGFIRAATPNKMKCIIPTLIHIGTTMSHPLVRYLVLSVFSEMDESVTNTQLMVYNGGLRFFIDQLNSTYLLIAEMAFYAIPTGSQPEDGPFLIQALKQGMYKRLITLVNRLNPKKLDLFKFCSSIYYISRLIIFNDELKAINVQPIIDLIFFILEASRYHNKYEQKTAYEQCLEALSHLQIYAFQDLWEQEEFLEFMNSLINQELSNVSTFSWELITQIIVKEISVMKLNISDSDEIDQFKKLTLLLSNKAKEKGFEGTGKLTASLNDIETQLD